MFGNGIVYRLRFQIGFKPPSRVVAGIFIQLLHELGQVPDM